MVWMWMGVGVGVAQPIDLSFSDNCLAFKPYFGHMSIYFATRDAVLAGLQKQAELTFTELSPADLQTVGSMLGASVERPKMDWASPKRFLLIARTADDRELMREPPKQRLPEVKSLRKFVTSWNAYLPDREGQDIRWPITVHVVDTTAGKRCSWTISQTGTITAVVEPPPAKDPPPTEVAPVTPPTE